MSAAKPAIKLPSKESVLAYLREHPDFLRENADLLEHFRPPERKHGNNVVDLQHFMVGNLQQRIKHLKSKYEGLISSSRDNMSTLHQVHTAVVDIVRAPTLEKLLEVITLDLVHLFAVDVVRLGLESEIADSYDPAYPEENYSGVAFIEPGTADKALGKDKAILLTEDTGRKFIPGFDRIFADCSALVASCALIKLHLPQTGRKALLAFGVRTKGHFHSGQGVELLSFLGKVIEHKLDQCLGGSGLDAF
jgi:uncharacterized protein YigA (DUF484 family)